MRRASFAAAVLFWCGCASAPLREDPPVTEELEHVTPQAQQSDGERIAEHADALVGITSLKTVTHLPDDCTGLVRYAYSLEGYELMPSAGTRGTNGVTAIWYAAREKHALHKDAPKAGDLVFFRETYDRDRDGRRDDGLTHVGVVESVEADGTVTFVHRSGRGVTKERMNPTRPRDRTVNDWLRMKSRSAPAALTGELFSGYASVRVLLGRE